MGELWLGMEDIPESVAQKMVGPRPPENFRCNGCTMSPDKVFGVDLSPACYWHDYAYMLGGGENMRLLSDRLFFHNLRSCGAGYFVSMAYYLAVRVVGHWFFNYRGHRPSPWGRLVIWAFNKLPENHQPKMRCKIKEGSNEQDEEG